MNRTHPRRRQALVLAAAATLLAGGLATAAGAAPAAKPSGKDRAALKVANAAAAQSDQDRGHVQEETWDVAHAQQAQRDAALQRKLRGQASVPEGRRPRQARPPRARGHRPGLRGPRRVRRPAAPGVSATPRPWHPRRRSPATFPSDGTPQQYDGPLHNQIPAPDRSVDNSTLWQPDYDRAHYEDMYFNRMKEYYEHQSSGRYIDRRRRHRVGEGPLQRGALRPRLLRQHRVLQHLARSCATRWRSGSRTVSPRA